MYTPEQQERLQIDAYGQPIKHGFRGEHAGFSKFLEKPSGLENKGLYTISVFTGEQQARLGVDKYGSPVRENQVTG